MNRELEDVKTIVVHDNCHDGTLSALILKDALPKAEVVFLRYGSAEHKSFKPREGLLFCDITPDKESDLDAFVGHGTYVLDHHKAAKEVVARFGRRGFFADEKEEPGVSGALLAFEHVWLPLYEDRDDALSTPLADGWKDVATLAGIYDTWQKQSPRWDEARALTAALRFYTWDTLLRAFEYASRSRGRSAGLIRLLEMFEIGKVLLERQAEDVARIVNGAYFWQGEGGYPRVAIVQGKENINEVAEAIGENADLVVGFWYFSVLEPTVEFSCRKRGASQFPLLDFVKHYGGGGHTGAGGFRQGLMLATDGRVRINDDPYSKVVGLVRAFMLSLGRQC